MSIADRIQRTDFFRRSPARLGGPADHKEWQHFIIHDAGLELLVNFSLADTVRWDGRPGQESGRLIVVARQGDRRHTAVERFTGADLDVESGRIDARFGRHTLRFADGAWHLSLRLPDLEATLRIRPQTWPAVSGNIPLGPGTAAQARTLSWLIVARAQAEGTVRLGGHTHAIRGALAYHDHNWGHFRWGDDFAWEWGQALPADPACPWSVVFVRMADRRRTRVLSQGLFLWRKEAQYRVFRDRDLSVEVGAPVSLEPHKLPAVMALLAPGQSADVPATLRATAEAGGDHLTLLFEPHHLTQVLIPDETDLRGVTRLNEASGTVQLDGTVGGEPVALRGPAIFEFVRG